MELPKDLVFTTDETRGYSRRRCGRGFAYYDKRGKLITSRTEKDRLNALAVPPAYTDVWLCPLPMGHLQATGRDARQRKQYRYHPLYTEWRDRQKYDQLHAFGETLPGIRRGVEYRLQNRELAEKEFACALVIKLLDRTGLRIGNEDYLFQNGSRGITTLVDRNVRVDARSESLAFDFTAKGGRHVTDKVTSQRLASCVKRLKELPGQRVFRYRAENGEYRDLRSEEVNAFLREQTGKPFTAKDFRTWQGSREAASALARLAGREASREEAWQEAVAAAAKALHNTKATARKAYIHPSLQSAEAYRFFGSSPWKDLPQVSGLSGIETALLHFLQP